MNNIWLCRCEECGKTSQSNEIVTGKYSEHPSAQRTVEEELNSEQIWKKDCGRRCAILHLERCLRYEDGKCKFPETEKAKEIVENYKKLKER